MFKVIPAIIVFLCVCSCNTKKTKSIDANTIIELQAKAAASLSGSSYQYLKSAEKILLKNSFSERDSLLMENYFALGEYFSSQKENDSSVYYNFKGIQAIDSISNQREVTFFFKTFYQLSSLSKYGDCKTLANEFEKRITPNDYGSKSLTYFFREEIAKNEQNYKQALLHNKKRTEYIRKLDDKNLTIPSHISRAKIFYDLNEKEKAYIILDSLIENEDEYTNDYRRQLYGEYAVYTFYDKQFDESLLFNLKALDNIKIDNASVSEKNNSLAVAYANIAEIQIELKQHTLAQKYIDSVYYIGFDQINEFTQRNVLKYQLLLQSVNGTDERKVTKFLDSIFKYQDKSYQKKYDQELIALKLETKKKEEVLAEQQATEIKAINLKNRLITVIISAILIILAGILFFFLRKYRQEQKALFVQQRLLRTQMNPHFIFNTLSSIHNLMSTNTERASKYLIKFSRLLRLVLENSLENYVTLEDELESIEQFIELQLLRFPNKFEYAISLNGLDNSISYAIPPMLLQPFIENAILHGFKGIKHLGQITISISEKNKYLECVIEDNGIGIQPSKKSKNKSVSVKLISDFLEKTTRSKISVLSKNNETSENSGVRVSFLIPFKINI